MQKLKGIGSGQNNKSCRITKLASHFSEVSVIFYTIFKIQQICLTIGVTFLQIRPWKDSLFCNVALGAAGRRGLPESGELAMVLGRGRARGGSLGSRGLVWVLGRGGGGRWWGARRRRPAAGAVRLFPVR
jgi:hypothetical protein